MADQIELTEQQTIELFEPLGVDFGSRTFAITFTWPKDQFAPVEIDQLYSDVADLVRRKYNYEAL